jgi:hypothetical protein
MVDPPRTASAIGQATPTRSNVVAENDAERAAAAAGCRRDPEPLARDTPRAATDDTRLRVEEEEEVADPRAAALAGDVLAEIAEAVDTDRAASDKPQVTPARSNVVAARELAELTAAASCSRRGEADDWDRDWEAAARGRDLEAAAD